MENKKISFESSSSRQVIRRNLMGLGGLGLASQVTGIHYCRLSRLLNGWLLPKSEEVEAIQKYINTGDIVSLADESIKSGDFGDCSTPRKAGSK